VSNAARSFETCVSSAAAGREDAASVASAASDTSALPEE